MEIKATLHKLIGIKREQDILLKEIKKEKEEHERLLKKIEDLEEARTIFQKAAQVTQEQISFHIENIVSHALAAVFDEPYEFKVDFVKRRNSTECDLLFVDEKGAELKPLDSCGYGAADIASLALRVAYWKLSEGVRNTMCLDEPTRNLSLDKQPFASKMIQQLSQKLQLQFIIVTHSIALAESSDKIFKVEKTINGSIVKEI